MKKLLVVFLILATLLTLSGCGKKSALEDAKNIQITVDQKTLDDVNKGINGN